MVPYWRNIGITSAPLYFSLLPLPVFRRRVPQVVQDIVQPLLQSQHLVKEVTPITDSVSTSILTTVGLYILYMNSIPWPSTTFLGNV